MRRLFDSGSSINDVSQKQGGGDDAGVGYENFDDDRGSVSAHGGGGGGSSSAGGGDETGGGGLARWVDCRRVTKRQWLGNGLAVVAVGLLVLVLLGLLAIFRNSDGPNSRVRFALVALGVKGGLDQSDLSGYLLRPVNLEAGDEAEDADEDLDDGDNDGFLGLDMGTSLWGIQKAQAKGAFEGLIPKGASSNLTDAGYIFQKAIKGYALSHPHLDHWQGVMVSSPDDVPNGRKPIFGIDSTLSTIETDFFNWLTWPNLGPNATGSSSSSKSDKRNPGLYIYETRRVQPDGTTWYRVEGTRMSLAAFPLVHGTRPIDGGARQVAYNSTAFLVESGAGYQVLYFGDTGPDQLQGVDNMARVWTAVAPLILNGTLRGILLECSFTNQVPDTQLYGHLNPKWFMNEMQSLLNITTAYAAAASPSSGSDDDEDDDDDDDNDELAPSERALEALRQVKILVVHIKPQSMVVRQVPNPPSDTRQLVLLQLQELNKDLQLTLLLPEQGDRVNL